MSRKRFNKPKSLVIVTRRTMNGATFFGLDAVMAQRLFIFLLATYSKAYKIDVIAGCLMGNHCHLVLYDRKGVVSDFCGSFFGKMAEAWQVYIDQHTEHMRPDKIWDGRQPNIVGIPHEGALVRETVYTMLNPEHHNVVERSEDYVGFVTTLDMIESGKQVKRWRPPYYFRRVRGAFKNQETLVFKVPPNYTREEWAKVVRLAIEQKRRESEATDADGQQANSNPDEENPVQANLPHSPLSEAETCSSTADDANQQGAEDDDLPETLEPVMPDFPCTHDEIAGSHLLPIEADDNWLKMANTSPNDRWQPLRYIPRPRSGYVPDYAGPRRYQKAAREEYKRFIQQYEQALDDMLAGKPAVFPCGTTGMRMFHNVQVVELSPEELEAREQRLCEPLRAAEQQRYPHRVHHFEDLASGH